MKKVLIAVFTCLALTSCSFGSKNNENPPVEDFTTINDSFIPENFDNTYGVDEIEYLNNFDNNFDATCRIRANYNTSKQSNIQIASGFVYEHKNDEYIVVTSAARTAYKQVASNGVSLSYKGLFEFKFNDGRKYRGSYLGSYVDFDIALYSIKTNDFLPVAKLGDSDALKVGETVGAIGTVDNSNDLFNTYVQGIVSGLNRQAKTYYGNKTISVFSSFQFDAPTNNGMQGGTVLNSKDEVVGIITNKQNAENGYESLSFAIAINDVKNIIDNIIQKGEYNKILLGFSGSNIDFINTVPWAKEQEIYTGIYVVEVSQDSKSQKAGLEKDSIIIGLKTMSGKTINIGSMEEFQSQLVRLNTGDYITLIVARNNQPIKEIKVEL